MKHTAFDEALRRRAERETFDTSPQADERLACAIREGSRLAAAFQTGEKAERDGAQLAGADKKRRAPARPRRAARWVPLLTGAAACLMVAALWAVRTPVDRVREEADDSPVQTAAFETVLPLASGAEGASVSALAPQGEALAVADRGVWRAEVHFSNETQGIWLVSWSVDNASGMLEPPDELIWMEPGASCTDHAAWPAEGTQEMPFWQYTAYRVTADILHWMDGEWLRPGEEGYAAQQALITDAYENGALVLAPGDWENGMAGPMALVLPDAMGSISALETYLAAGLIVEESGGAGQMRTAGEAAAAARATDTPAADRHEGVAITSAPAATPEMQAVGQPTAAPAAASFMSGEAHP